MKKEAFDISAFDSIKIESVNALRHISGGETYTQTGSGSSGTSTTKDWMRESDGKSACSSSDSVDPWDIGTGWV
jgi:hypothetical protein